MATSGTVSTTVVTTRQVIDHAYRRCKLVPQQITAEMIDTARKLLFLLLSTLTTKNIPLWTIGRTLLPLYERQGAVDTVPGTVELYDVLLRNYQRLSGTAAASAGVAANAFDGILTTACNAGVGGNISLAFTSDTPVTTYGILPNVTETWDLTISGTPAALPTETVYHNAALSVEAGKWFWFESDGDRPYSTIQFQVAGPGTMHVLELVCGNTPSEIPLGKINRNDYANLPNKEFTGRPTQYWPDRQLDRPILRIWPTPDPTSALTYIAAYGKRHIQDVGTLTQNLEIPQRFYLAVICELARQAGRETKDVDPNLLPQLDADAREQWATCWDGETDGTPVKFMPNISPYTR